MKDALTFLGLVLLALILIVSLAGIFYSILCGIWGYNPTSISLFNLKLGLTSFFTFVIFSAITKAIDENL